LKGTLRLRADQWARVKDLFERALEQPPDRRLTWVEQAAIGDSDLLREVHGLITAHDTAGDFLERPPAVNPADVHLFPPGTVLGSYEIVDELGRGGGGIVYLAEDRRLGRRVALKLVAAGADPQLRDRLRREARAAATIAHPSVATIYALEEFDDQLFIVSEYVRGRTLRAALAEGPLPRERALAIARDIAQALRAAHQAGVIHRDLKPENVLLSDTGTVKVVDFGIARVTGDGVTQLTQHGALLGTPAYMAPEQLLGTPADARADIYAFGIVLSEMIAGRHPGMARTPQSTATPDGSLTEIARQCTQLDPAARIQTAELLLATLERARAGREQTRTAATWWWEFHQASTAVVYWVTLWPVWLGRLAIGGPLGRSFFIVVLAAVVVSACLRLHLWFTSRFYPSQLSWVRRRAAIWIAAGDAIFAVGLVSGGLLIRQEDSSIGIVLVSIGLGAAVAFLVIEAATARAAFGSSE
jgi:predicted Ser/Thr protein kinase